MKPDKSVGKRGRPPSNSTRRCQIESFIYPEDFLLDDDAPSPPPPKRQRTVVTEIYPEDEWLSGAGGGGGAEFRGGGGKENAAPNSPRRRPLDGRADGDGAVDSGAERREDAALDGDARGGKASVGQGQNDRDEQQRSLDESWDTPAGDAGHHPARKDDDGKDKKADDGELLGEQEDVDFGDAGGGEEAVSEEQGRRDGGLDEEASVEAGQRDGLDGQAEGHGALDEPRAGPVADAASRACKRLCKQPVGQLFAHAGDVDGSRPEGRASTPGLLEESTGEPHPNVKRGEDVEAEVREAVAKCVDAVEEKTGEPSASPFVQSGDGDSNARDVGMDVDGDVDGELPAQNGRYPRGPDGQRLQASLRNQVFSPEQRLALDPTINSIHLLEGEISKASDPERREELRAVHKERMDAFLLESNTLRGDACMPTGELCKQICHEAFSRKAGPALLKVKKKDKAVPVAKKKPRNKTLVRRGQLWKCIRNSHPRQSSNSDSGNDDKEVFIKPRTTKPPRDHLADALRRGLRFNRHRNRSLVQSGDGDSSARDVDMDVDVDVDVDGRLPAQKGDGGQQGETRREENFCQYKGSGCRGHYQFYDNFHLSRCDGCNLLTCDTCEMPCSGEGCPCTLCENCMYEGGNMCPDCRDGNGTGERECEDDTSIVLCYGCDRGACCKLASVHEGSDCPEPHIGGGPGDSEGGNNHSYDGEKKAERRPLHEQPDEDSFTVWMHEAVLRGRLHTKEFAKEAKKLLSEWGGEFPRLADVFEQLVSDPDHHASSVASSEPSGDTASNESGEGTDGDESAEGTASNESGESNGEDDASASGSNDGCDHTTFHPKEFHRVPPNFILQAKGKKINSKHYKLMPGYRRLEIVCLDFMKAFDYANNGWSEELGKSIFDALTADGYVFMTVDENNKYVPVEEPGPDSVFDAWLKTRKGASYDDKSYRKCIYFKLVSLKSSEAQRKVKDDAEARMKYDFEDARGSPSLGVYNYDSDSDAHPRNPGQDLDVTKEQYAQCQKEIREEIEKQSANRSSPSTAPTARSCPCGERSCNYESCGVDMTWKILRRCPEFFEWALEKEELWEEQGEQPKLDEVVTKIKSCNFECFEGMTDEKILLSLLNPNNKDKSGCRCETFKERWDGGFWRQMFGDIVFGIERRLMEECYCCGRKVGKYMEAAAMKYGFHTDHLLKFWRKDDRCSELRKGSIARMLLESLKTRLVCGFCHENGKIPGYERHLQYVCKLTYDFRTDDGTTHRTASEALDLLEMKCFILELKSRGAFFTGKDPKMTWRTLEFLVWKYFRVILSDVVYFTEDNWESRIRTQSFRGRRLINTVIVNLLKKLGVRCMCGEDFSNHIPARMSGIHMDHRGEKTRNPSTAVNFYIDVLIAELRRGKCNPLCCFCHGDKTF